MTQCHICYAYDSPFTFRPLRICHHWKKKKQGRRQASLDFKYYIHACIWTVLFIVCFSKHLRWARFHWLPLRYIFLKLLYKNKKTIGFKSVNLPTLWLLLAGEKHAMKKKPVNIWHPKGICSWCELQGKQRLLRCLGPALTEKQKGARKTWLFPWIRKQKKSADFFFSGRPRAFSRWGKQPHLITQFEQSWWGA